MQLKTDGKVRIKAFISNIGSPQGDSISGILFEVYLESSLRKVREKIDIHSLILDASYIQVKQPTNLPSEAVYADDSDFIDMNEQRRKYINDIVEPILLETNLIVNNTKT